MPPQKNYYGLRYYFIEKALVKGTVDEYVYELTVVGKGQQTEHIFHMSTAEFCVFLSTLAKAMETDAEVTL